MTRTGRYSHRPFPIRVKCNDDNYNKCGQEKWSIGKFVLSVLLLLLITFPAARSVADSGIIRIIICEIWVSRNGSGTISRALYDEILDNGLNKSNKIQVVERKQVDNQLDQLKRHPLESPSCRKRENALKLGKRLEADWIVFGDVSINLSAALEESFFFDPNAVPPSQTVFEAFKTSTGQKIELYRAVISDDEVFELADEIAEKILALPNLQMPDGAKGSDTVVIKTVERKLKNAKSKRADGLLSDGERKLIEPYLKKGADALRRSNNKSAARKRKYLKDALHWYQKAIDLKQDSVTGLHKVADVLRELAVIERSWYDQSKIVHSYLDRAIALQPDSYQLYVSKGVAYFRDGDRTNAVESFQKAITLNKNAAESYKWLARTLDVEHKAIAAAKKAVALKDKDAAAQYIFGMLLLKHGRNGAVTALENAVALSPTNADFSFGLGLALLEYDLAERAAKAFRKTLELDPQNYRSSSQLGNVLLRQGDVEAAISVQHEIIKHHPDFADGYYHLSSALIKKRDYYGAIAALKKAIHLKKRVAKYYYNLSDALRGKGDLKKSSWAFEEALTIEKGLVNLSPYSP